MKGAQALPEESREARLDSMTLPLLTYTGWYRTNVQSRNQSGLIHAEDVMLISRPALAKIPLYTRDAGSYYEADDPLPVIQRRHWSL